MDMSPPPKPSAYLATNEASSKAIKTAAEKAKRNSSKEIHNNNDDEIVRCGGSCDGT